MFEYPKTTEELIDLYERREGAFERKFNLPEEVDSDSVTAEMKNGELIVSIRKIVNVVPKKVNIAVE